MQIPTSPRNLGKPCRNFNFQTMLSLVDPKDNREKLVLSNYIGGGRGTLIFIDVESRDAEEIPLPDDCGAWALCFSHERYLVAGTDPEKGLICRLDLPSRQWAEPAHNDETTYHWNVAKGSDGHLYFTTYPTAEVLQYDVIQNSIRSIGRPTNDLGNFYSKEICGSSPGWIFVTGGFAECHVSAWNMETRQWSPVAADGHAQFSLIGADANHLQLNRNGVREVYSIPELKKVAPAAPDALHPDREAMVTSSSTPGMYGFETVLKNGRIAGVAGQEYFIENEKGEREYSRIPFEPPTTVMHKSLVLDDNGDLWGPSSFGQTIFRYSPADGSSWNSLGVCRRMGEVYGMVSLNGRLFMACYAGGDHVVYDPSKPWDQRNNVNPRTLDPVNDNLCRAVGGSIIGPDGAVWSGWRLKYGTYGGALSRVDPTTLELNVWQDPIPGQTVMGVAADEKYVFFTTNPSGEGLPLKEDEPGWFGIWVPGSGLKASYRMGLGDLTAGLVAMSGFVFIMQGDRLAVFDIATEEFRKEIVLGEPCSKLLKLADGILAAFCGQNVFWVDTRTIEIIGKDSLGIGMFGAVAAKDGRSFFFGSDMDLFHYQPTHVWDRRSS